MEAVARMARTCPRCSGNLFRVRRRLIDRVLHLLRPVRRYKCEDCGQSTLMRAQPKAAAALAAADEPSAAS
jgi:ribosomal protein S27AE